LGRGDIGRRLPKRLSKVQVKGAVQITVSCPRFMSAKDEHAFFSWLRSLPSVRTVRGTGMDLRITVATRHLSQRDLRELLAIFHRYGVDKRVLAEFDRLELKWFRDPKAYWFAGVFGTRRKGEKRS